MYTVYGRQKSWDEKIKIVRNSYLRIRDNPNFPPVFYRNLFFLKPRIKEHFKDTDFEQQHMLLKSGVDHLLGFLEDVDQMHKNHVIRISETHGHKNLNIHPHNYYYWTEALIMTGSELDKKWEEQDGMEYYWREMLFYPISFMISQYFK